MLREVSTAKRCEMAGKLGIHNNEQITLKPSKRDDMALSLLRCFVDKHADCVCI